MVFFVSLSYKWALFLHTFDLICVYRNWIQFRTQRIFFSYTAEVFNRMCAACVYCAVYVFRISLDHSLDRSCFFLGMISRRTNLFRRCSQEYKIILIKSSIESNQLGCLSVDHEHYRWNSLSTLMKTPERSKEWDRDKDRERERRWKTDRKEDDVNISFLFLKWSCLIIGAKQRLKLNYVNEAGKKCETLEPKLINCVWWTRKRCLSAFQLHSIIINGSFCHNNQCWWCRCSLSLYRSVCLTDWLACLPDCLQVMSFTSQVTRIEKKLWRTTTTKKQQQNFNTMSKLICNYHLH